MTDREKISNLCRRINPKVESVFLDDESWQEAFFAQRLTGRPIDNKNCEYYEKPKPNQCVLLAENILITNQRVYWWSDTKVLSSALAKQWRLPNELYGTDSEILPGVYDITDVLPRAVTGKTLSTTCRQGVFRNCLSAALAAALDQPMEALDDLNVPSWGTDFKNWPKFLPLLTSRYQLQEDYVWYLNQIYRYDDQRKTFHELGSDDQFTEHTQLHFGDVVFIGPNVLNRDLLSWTQNPDSNLNEPVYLGNANRPFLGYDESAQHLQIVDFEYSRALPFGGTLQVLADRAEHVFYFLGLGEDDLVFDKKSWNAESPYTIVPIKEALDYWKERHTYGGSTPLMLKVFRARFERFTAFRTGFLNFFTRKDQAQCIPSL